MFTEYCGAGPLRVQNTIMQEIFIYLIPNGIWVVVPFLVMIQLWSLLATDNKQSSKFN